MLCVFCFGFRVWDFWGLGFGVWCLVFGVYDLGFGVKLYIYVYIYAYKIHVYIFVFMVCCLVFRVWGLLCLVFGV